MSRVGIGLLLALLGALLLAGCGQPSESLTSGAEESASSAPSAAGSAAAVETVSCQQWDEQLAAQRGKIVVVDTWATWCVPCREEFPKLVALHEKYAPQGVVCMSVSVDDPEQQPAAAEFLTQQRADFANYLIEDKPEAWWDKWEIKSIPVVLVFGPDGTLAKKFDLDNPDDQFTYADVEALVVELLKQSPAGASG